MAVVGEIEKKEIARENGERGVWCGERQKGRQRERAGKCG